MSSENRKVPISYIERTVAQADVVEKLANQVKDAPDDASVQQLEIEMEKLAFYQIAAKGNPKVRAANVTEIARSTALGRAVTQPLPRLN